MAQIPIPEGKVVLVDDDVYEMLSYWDWDVSRDGYVFTLEECDGGFRTYHMHRMIMLPPPGFVVDHIHHDPLDLRRCSLRVCTVAENGMNARKIASSSSRFKGVYRVRKHRRYTGKWRARVKLSGQLVLNKDFATELEAARAYDAAALEYFGEFACTNEMLGLYI